MPTIIHDDTELLKATQAGDDEAFVMIYERYWERLYRVALRKVRVTENAKEIVQDIFLELWMNRASLHVEVLEYYLLRVLKFKVIDHYRKEIVRQNYAELMYSTQSEANWDTEEELAYNGLNQAIIECIEELPVRTKAVFELSRIQHKPITEIATILKVTTRTVDNHLNYALNFLRLRLKDYLPVVLIFLGFYGL